MPESEPNSHRGREEAKKDPETPDRIFLAIQDAVNLLESCLAARIQAVDRAQGLQDSATELPGNLALRKN